MAFQVSPGVQVREIDVTNVVPAVSSTIGAFAGEFSWGCQLMKLELLYQRKN